MSTSLQTTFYSQNKKIVFVLGMAFVHEEFVQGLQYNFDSIQKSVPSQIRDRERILTLQKNFYPSSKYHIVTINRDQPEEDCEPFSHIQGSFSARLVRSVKQFSQSLMNQTKNAKFRIDTILLDYFRFPSAYMEMAYVPFFKALLPALVQNQFVDAHTKIVFPNYSTLTSLAQLKHLKITLLSKEQCELYEATEKTNQKYLGGYKNEDQIHQLDQKYPFCLAQYTMDPTKQVKMKKSI